MKASVVDYRYRCHGLRIVCTNGLVVRLTDYPRSLLMSNGSVYMTDSGYQFTGLQASTSMAAAVMDLEGIAGASGISRDQLASGVFDSARMYAFATSWRAPVEDQEPLGAAVLGRTTLQDERYRVEIMMLIDALSQSVGRTYSPTCDKEFGGQGYAGCKVNLGPITATGSITAVTSNSVFRDSARTEDADHFGAGYIRFTSGPNAGLAALGIKRYEADGTIETYEPAYYPVQPGHAYEMVPGCRKREQDCRDKWNNILNYGGFTRVPSSSVYQEVGTN